MPQNASELVAREHGRVILRMEELEAAAAGLAMEPELDGAAAAAPVDISTTTASELDVNNEGEPKLPNPRSRVVYVLRGLECPMIILASPVLTFVGRPLRYRADCGPCRRAFELPNCRWTAHIA